MAQSSGGADDYIDDDENNPIDVEELSWEDGHYDADEWGDSGPDTPGGADDGGTTERGAQDTGVGTVAFGPTLPADRWRSELQSPGQKREYLRNVLNITDRSSKEYKSAYRYISLIGRGERPATGERWGAVRAVAQIEYDRKHPEAPPPPPTGPTGPGNFKRGDYLDGTVSWHMQGERDRRTVSGTYTLDTQKAVDLANAGQLGKAFATAYLNSGSGRRSR